MKTTERQQRQPSVLTRMARALSFAQLAGLVRDRKGAASTPTKSGAKPARAGHPPSAPGSHRAAKPQQELSREPLAQQDDAPSEMTGDSLEAEGRRRERARCQAILMSEAGQRNFELAKHLALETRMTRKEALAVLQAAPAPQPRGSFAHPDRAARNPKVSAVAEPAMTKEQAVGARWDRALSQANPSTRKPTSSTPAPANAAQPRGTA